MKTRLIFLFGALITLWSCGSEEPGMSKEDLVLKIDSLQEVVYGDLSDVNERKEGAEVLIDYYDQFTTDYPDDENTAEYLFFAGEGAKGLKQWERAIGFFDKLGKNYPDHKRAAMCLFIKADIYEQSLGEKDKAVELYKEFLELYPDHDFAEGAQFSIDNIDKSLEDIIKGFEQQNSEGIDTSGAI